jgi:hypothetical protein
MKEWMNKWMKERMNDFQNSKHTDVVSKIYFSEKNRLRYWNFNHYIFTLIFGNFKSNKNSKSRRSKIKNLENLHIYINKGLFWSVIYIGQYNYFSMSDDVTGYK